MDECKKCIDTEERQKRNREEGSIFLLLVFFFIFGMMTGVVISFTIIFERLGIF